MKAAITVSLDGYVTGPDDREGRGLGVGGEQLHYRVMGGPWTSVHHSRYAVRVRDAVLR